MVYLTAHSNKGLVLSLSQTFGVDPRLHHTRTYQHETCAPLMPLTRYDLYLTKMFYRLLEEFQIACLTLLALPHVIQRLLVFFLLSSEVSAVERRPDNEANRTSKIFVL